MLLTISPQAQALIEAKRTLADLLVLDFIDGDSPQFNQAISCTLGVSFRLLIIPAASQARLNRQHYNETLTTAFGPVIIKSTSKMYLDAHTTLDINPTTHKLMLKGDSGIIAPTIDVVTLN